jgi:hypothetical protein
MHTASNDGEPTVDEGTAAEVAFPTDELAALRQMTSAALPAYLSQELRSPSYDDFMAPIEDFIVLQRLMRAALDGKLGPGFPMRTLIALEQATRGAVPSQPTIRWEPAQRDSTDLEASLKSAGADASKTYADWHADRVERAQADRPTCGAVSR